MKWRASVNSRIQQSIKLDNYTLNINNIAYKTQINNISNSSSTSHSTHMRQPTQKHEKAHLHFA